MTPRNPAPVVSPLALFRFAVVSEVLVAELRGLGRSEAVERTASRVHRGPDGMPRTVGVRTLYTWLAAYRERGLAGLENRPRSRAQTDGVLEPALVAFLVAEKEKDLRASVPELLRRAATVGLLRVATEVDRTTAWRALKRRGIATRRQPKVRDQRRFAKRHRLQLVLCDGKRFRAGPARLRRVALFFIDDATRHVPLVKVGTTETAELFLGAFHELLQRVGRIGGLYVDRGSGFIAHDTRAVLAGLDIPHILGEARYPEGHGKIERFNRTAQEDLLRHMADDDIDADCTALELRIAHYLRTDYNRRPHGGLGGDVSPEQAFLADERPLLAYPDSAELRRHFFVTEHRTVSNDHVVKLAGSDWEVPRGLARQRIAIRRDVLEPEHYRLWHDDRWHRLQRVRLHHNADGRRGTSEKPAPSAKPTKGAALRSAEAALAPITQPDGGFVVPGEEDP